MTIKITGFFIYFLIFCSLLGLIFPFNGSLAETGDRTAIFVQFKTGEIETIEVAEKDADRVLSEYSSREDVKIAEPEADYKITLTPNDTYYDEQWYLEKIKAPKAWGEIDRISEVVIAIIDSGVQINHLDLGPNIWVNTDEIPGNGIDDDRNGFIDDRNGWDFIDNVPDPSPKFKEGFTEEGVTHGTIVAGIIAAVGNNNSGIAGISWQAKIMSLRALDDKGEGTTSRVVRAIDYAIANRADVINFSFVGFTYSQGLYEAIERAHRAGIIMVAAAGNEQDDGSGYNLDKIPMYPACHDGDNGENMVIGVAATDTLDQKTNFSSYGFSCVDIAAPGVSVFSTVPYEPSKNLGPKVFNKYYDGYWSGTSVAAPIVTGAIALIEGVNRDLNVSQVKETLMSTADNISRLNPGYLGQLGSGRINLYDAVKEAKSLLGSFDSEILLAPLENHISQIKRSNIKGDKKVSFEAYAPNFLGGAEVAAGDIDGDGEEEIIVGAGNGGGPHIRIFDNKGNLKSQFFAYQENFRGGVNVAVGDINGDGKDEIVAGAGFGGGPQVRIFDDHAKLLGQFFAYDENFRGGVNVAVGDIDGGAARNREEIITAPGKTGGPHIRVFDSAGNVKNQFFAYNDTFRGGVSIAVGDIDGDGLIEIVTGAGSGGSPHVRVFEIDGTLLGSFYGFEADYTGGVNVGVIKIKK